MEWSSLLVALHVSLMATVRWPLSLPLDARDDGYVRLAAMYHISWFQYGIDLISRIGFCGQLARYGMQRSDPHQTVTAT
jgi:hypothetical protein